MPIFGFFFTAIAHVLGLILNVIMIAVIARAILSWVSPDPYNPIVRFIHNFTEPILYPIRQRLPFQFSGIDLSPIVVFLAIIFLKQFVVNSLFYIGQNMR